jgi:hypothetical protein
MIEKWSIYNFEISTEVFLQPRYAESTKNTGVIESVQYLDCCF